MKPNTRRFCVMIGEEGSEPLQRMWVDIPDRPSLTATHYEYEIGKLKSRNAELRARLDAVLADNAAIRLEIQRTTKLIEQVSNIINPF